MGQMALALCYFVSYVVLLESREQMRRLMVWYVYGATVVAFVGLSQTSLTTRAVGLQGDANMYALYELAAIPIAASLASISTGKHRRRWFWWWCCWSPRCSPPSRAAACWPPSASWSSCCGPASSAAGSPYDPG